MSGPTRVLCSRFGHHSCVHLAALSPRQVLRQRLAREVLVHRNIISVTRIRSVPRAFQAPVLPQKRSRASFEEDSAPAECEPPRKKLKTEETRSAPVFRMIRTVFRGVIGDMPEVFHSTPRLPSPVIDMSLVGPRWRPAVIVESGFSFGAGPDTRLDPLPAPPIDDPVFVEVREPSILGYLFGGMETLDLCEVWGRIVFLLFLLLFSRCLISFAWFVFQVIPVPVLVLVVLLLPVTVVTLPRFLVSRRVMDLIDVGNAWRGLGRLWA